MVSSFRLGDGTSGPSVHPGGREKERGQVRGRGERERGMDRERKMEG
jgi:hypothetical protein